MEHSIVRNEDTCGEEKILSLCPRPEGECTGEPFYRMAGLYRGRWD